MHANPNLRLTPSGQCIIHKELSIDNNAFRNGSYEQAGNVAVATPVQLHPAEVNEVRRLYMRVMR